MAPHAGGPALRSAKAKANGFTQHPDLSDLLSKRKREGQAQCLSSCNSGSPAIETRSSSERAPHVIYEPAAGVPGGARILDRDPLDLLFCGQIAVKLTVVARRLRASAWLHEHKMSYASPVDQQQHRLISAGGDGLFIF